MIFKNCVKTCGPWCYLLFRVLVGFLFFSHGMQKVFGIWGSSGAAPLLSMMGVAGIIEFLVGLGVLVGVFTRLAALGGALIMLIAYFMVHASKGLLPIMNGGELAVLYFAAFLAIHIHGAGIWSLEKEVLNKEIF